LKITAKRGENPLTATEKFGIMEIRENEGELNTPEE
jgi:hypothetical protein